MNAQSISDHLERIFTILNAENAYRNESSIVSIESDLTLVELFALLHSFQANEEDTELPPEHLIALIEFLAQRWDRIKNSNLIYPHKPQTTANVICLLLAQELEILTGISRYRLLMPTITIDCNEISSTEIKENSLELHEFVLNDDNDRIIDIVPCMDFALEDGVLKHTSLFAGKPKALSETEIDRVIHHSDYAEKYFYTIRERADAKNKSNSVGSVLSRFSESLKRGSTHGSYHGGEELNAGHNANEGIFYFSEWLAMLSESERKNLFNRTIVGSNKRFSDIWGRAARPNDANYTSTNYCVALIADDIDLLLKSNQDLYDIYPQNQAAAQIKFLAPLDDNVASAKQELLRALRSNHYQVTASYHNEQQKAYNARFKEQLPRYFADHARALTHLNGELQLHFSQRLISHIANSVEDIDDFIKLVRAMPNVDCLMVLKLCADWIFPRINYARDLINILELYPENERLQIIMNAPLNVSSIIRNHIQLRELLKVLPQEDKIKLLSIENDLLTQINNVEKLVDILDILTETQHGELIKLMGHDKLNNIINNDFITALENKLSAENKQLLREFYQRETQPENEFVMLKNDGPSPPANKHSFFHFLHMLSGNHADEESKDPIPNVRSLN